MNVSETACKTRAETVLSDNDLLCVLLPGDSERLKPKMYNQKK